MFLHETLKTERKTSEGDNEDWEIGSNGQ
jgi:hypothetical protein